MTRHPAAIREVAVAAKAAERRFNGSSTRAHSKPRVRACRCATCAPCAPRMDGGLGNAGDAAGTASSPCSSPRRATDSACGLPRGALAEVNTVRGDCVGFGGGAETAAWCPEGAKHPQRGRDAVLAARRFVVRSPAVGRARSSGGGAVAEGGACGTWFGDGEAGRGDGGGWADGVETRDGSGYSHPSRRRRRSTGTRVAVRGGRGRDVQMASLSLPDDAGDLRLVGRGEAEDARDCPEKISGPDPRVRG